MQKYVIAPSLLSANFAHLGTEAKSVIEAGADWLHFDVMDNHYVPNLTIGPMVCQSLRNDGIHAPIDVHLMTNPVDNLIQAFAKAGANYITIHPEATQHLDRSLALIRDLHCKAGIAINPATTLHCLDFLWDKIDLILIMAVNPGFGGQQFIPQSINKITQARKLISDSGKNIHLSVDGGIKVDNIGEVALAGADVFVSGSGIFNEKNYALTIKKMRQAIDHA